MRTPGEIVRDKREIAGKTLTEMSKVLGCSDSHLCDIEGNRRTPSDDLLKRICRKLRLDFEYMSMVFGRTPERIREGLLRKGAELGTIQCHFKVLASSGGGRDRL